MRHLLATLRCVVEGGDAQRAMSNAKYLWEKQQPDDRIIYGDATGGDGYSSLNPKSSSDGRVTVGCFSARIPEDHPLFQDKQAIIQSLRALLVLFHDKLPRRATDNHDYFRYAEIIVGDETDAVNVNF